MVRDTYGSDPNSLCGYGFNSGFVVGRSDKKHIPASTYNLASRVDEQARLFPELEKETEARRARLNAPTRDQNSAGYKDDLSQG